MSGVSEPAYVELRAKTDHVCRAILLSEWLVAAE